MVVTILLSARPTAEDLGRIHIHELQPPENSPRSGTMHCQRHEIEQHIRACRRPFDSDLPDDGEDLPLRISGFGGSHILYIRYIYIYIYK